MAEPDVAVGERATLSFEIEWVDPEPAGTAADATLGRMAAYVAGQLVWGDADQNGRTGFEWPWIELFEHLALAWRYLEWEEIDPLGVGGETGAVRARAEDRWQDLPENEVLREDELLRGFERSHDLAAALKGAWAPSIWLLRAGNTCTISAGGVRAVASVEAVMATLSGLGDAIRGRLSACKDERAQDATRAWARRRRQGGPQEDPRAVRETRPRARAARR